MDEIIAICAKHGIAIIEDAACAIGTTDKGRPVGAIGDIGCFSFHPRKVITTGEGGMVTTNRDDIADLVRSMRNHGATGAPDPSIEPHGPWTMGTFNRIGHNLRLSDIQAAVGIAQMAKLDDLLAERRRLAAGYRDRLAGLHNVVLPALDIGHSYQSFVIRIAEGGRKRRNAVMSGLAADNIQTRPVRMRYPSWVIIDKNMVSDPMTFHGRCSQRIRPLPYHYFLAWRMMISIA